MAVSTPCIDLCVMDQAGGLCLGCGRTLAEIAVWVSLPESERLVVMAALPGRPRATQPRPAETPPTIRRA